MLEDRNATAGCMISQDRAAEWANVCVWGGNGGGGCRGSLKQPVEEPLAPDISSGLADYSHYWIHISEQRSVVAAGNTLRRMGRRP